MCYIFNGKQNEHLEWFFSVHIDKKEKRSESRSRLLNGKALHKRKYKTNKRSFDFKSMMFAALPVETYNDYNIIIGPLRLIIKIT